MSGVSGMRPWRIATIAACTAFGLALAWPYTWASLRNDVTWGFVREVLVERLPGQSARLSVVYDFTVRGELGPVTWLGWSQAGPWLTPVDDPVLPTAEAEALAVAWRGERLRYEERGMRSPPCKVMYRANDPGGTAFILFQPGAGVWSHRLGVALVLTSLLLCLPIPGRRRS